MPETCLTLSLSEPEGNFTADLGDRTFGTRYEITYHDGTAQFPLGIETSIHLISSIYLPILSALHKEGKLNYPLFHQIMEGVLTL